MQARQKHTHRNAEDGCFVRETIVFAEHKTTTLGSSMDSRCESEVVLEIVQMCREDVHVWYNLVHEAPSTRRDVVCSKEERLYK